MDSLRNGIPQLASATRLAKDFGLDARCHGELRECGGDKHAALPRSQWGGSLHAGKLPVATYFSNFSPCNATLFRRSAHCFATLFPQYEDCICSRRTLGRPCRPLSSLPWHYHQNTSPAHHSRSTLPQDTQDREPTQAGLLARGAERTYSHLLFMQLSRLCPLGPPSRTAGSRPHDASCLSTLGRQVFAVCSFRNPVSSDKSPATSNLSKAA